MDSKLREYNWKKEIHDKYGLTRLRSGAGARKNYAAMAGKRPRRAAGPRLSKPAAKAVKRLWRRRSRELLRQSLCLQSMTPLTILRLLMVTLRRSVLWLHRVMMISNALETELQESISLCEEKCNGTAPTWIQMARHSCLLWHVVYWFCLRIM